CWNAQNIDPAVISPVANVTGAVAIAGGECALLGNGDVDCWATTANVARNADLTLAGTLRNAAALGAFGVFACVLHPEGTIECAGDDTVGELGNGVMTSSTTPMTGFVVAPGAPTGGEGRRDSGVAGFGMEMVDGGR